jgi:pimeloyl-ACP methyl ester carboxylesterase
MPKTHPVLISSKECGLAGNLVLPDGASPDSPVPGALIVGGPGPVAMERYSPEGVKNWPVQWTEGLAASGLAGLCYDQRGSGLSSGLYHEAGWAELYDDARAALEMLRLQPEVRRTAVIAWGEGCAFALQLAAEGMADALVLLSPPGFTAGERYAREIARLAARKGLSERVVGIRVGQWKQEVEALAARVAAGERTATTDVGGTPVTTNLARLLKTLTYDPAELAAAVSVPVLLLHGEEDAIIPPEESQALQERLGARCDRITYPGASHFLYRYSRPLADAAGWLRSVLA